MPIPENLYITENKDIVAAWTIFELIDMHIITVLGCSTMHLVKYGIRTITVINEQVIIGHLPTTS